VRKSRGEQARPNRISKHKDGGSTVFFVGMNVDYVRGKS